MLCTAQQTLLSVKPSPTHVAEELLVADDNQYLQSSGMKRSGHMLEGVFRRLSSCEGWEIDSPGWEALYFSSFKIPA